MPTDKKLDPTGERAEATEAMESTPISGKDHEYRADGDHRPRQDEGNVEGDNAAPSGVAAKDQTAPAFGVETERHISEGIPGAGQPADGDRAPATQK